jgi:hypothetical protein
MENGGVAIKLMHKPFENIIDAKRAYREFVMMNLVNHKNVMPHPKEEGYRDTCTFSKSQKFIDKNAISNNLYPPPHEIPLFGSCTTPPKKSWVRHCL